MDIAKTSSVLFSIGHSNHTIEQFLDLLGRHGIHSVADVRSSPYSRYSPQFSQPMFERSLQECGINYVFLGVELGARRHEAECYLDGKVDYSQVPRTEAFQQGMARLVDMASRSRTAMLCAEKDPLTCHRTILVARHAKEFVGDVLHILPYGALETQSEAEQRLLVECNLQEQNLFLTRQQRLDDAYQKRAAHIAYEEPAPYA